MSTPPGEITNLSGGGARVVSACAGATNAGEKRAQRAADTARRLIMPLYSVRVPSDSFRSFCMAHSPPDCGGGSVLFGSDVGELVVGSVGASCVGPVESVDGLVGSELA